MSPKILCKLFEFWPQTPVEFWREEWLVNFKRIMSFLLSLRVFIEIPASEYFRTHVALSFLKRLLFLRTEVVWRVYFHNFVLSIRKQWTPSNEFQLVFVNFTWLQPKCFCHSSMSTHSKVILKPQFLRPKRGWRSKLVSIGIHIE
jgi:hypothetical protein